MVTTALRGRPGERASSKRQARRPQVAGSAAASQPCLFTLLPLTGLQGSEGPSRDLLSRLEDPAAAPAGPALAPHASSQLGPEVGQEGGGQARCGRTPGPRQGRRASKNGGQGGLQGLGDVQNVASWRLLGAEQPCPPATAALLAGPDSRGWGLPLTPQTAWVPGICRPASGNTNHPEREALAVMRSRVFTVEFAPLSGLPGTKEMCRRALIGVDSF